MADPSWDSQSGQVVGPDGTTTILGENARRLLVLLEEANGDVVSRNDLLDGIWGTATATDDSLYHAVAELRRALGSGGSEIIVTVPRKGYMLPAGMAAAGDAGRKRSRVTIMIGLMAATIAVAAFFLLQKTSPDRPGDTGPSLVVMAFENMGDDARWTRLGAGISSDLANDLAKIQWLRVLTGEAAQPVDYRLSGAVQAEAGMVQVSARLVASQNGEILWSDRWRGGEDQVFDMQDRIYAKVNAAIGSDWTGAVARDAGAQAKARGTDSLSAYENFLLGAEHKHKFNMADYAIATKYLKRAIEIDPEFAKAWTTLSIVYALMGSNLSDPEELRASQVERRAAILTAAKLAPNDPQVLIQMNWVHGHDGNPEQAEIVLRRAVKLGASNADVLAEASWVGNWRSVVGPDSVEWAAQAKALNENWPNWYAMGTALSHFNLGDYPATIAAMTEAPEFIERHLYTAAAQALLGNLSEAQAARDALLVIVPDFTLSNYVQARAIHDEATQAPLLEGARLAGVPLGDAFSQ